MSVRCVSVCQCKAKCVNLMSNWMFKVNVSQIKAWQWDQVDRVPITKALWSSSSIFGSGRHMCLTSGVKITFFSILMSAMSLRTDLRSNDSWMMIPSTEYSCSVELVTLKLYSPTRTVSSDAWNLWRNVQLNVRRFVQRVTGKHSGLQ